MVEVLQPLKVGHCYTTNIGKHVWDHLDAPGLQDLIGLESSWPICSLQHNLSLDMLGVMHV